LPELRPYDSRTARAYWHEGRRAGSRRFQQDRQPEADWRRRKGFAVVPRKLGCGRRGGARHARLRAFSLDPSFSCAGGGTVASGGGCSLVAFPPRAKHTCAVRSSLGSVAFPRPPGDRDMTPQTFQIVIQLLCGIFVAGTLIYVFMPSR